MELPAGGSAFQSCELLNALAHGRIAYLDSGGQHTDGQAAMLAFASVRTERGRVIALNILRTHQDDFCDFVMAWADWLSDSPVADILNQQDPLAA